MSKRWTWTRLIALVLMLCCLTGQAETALAANGYSYYQGFDYFASSFADVLDAVHQAAYALKTDYTIRIYDDEVRKKILRSDLVRWQVLSYGGIFSAGVADVNGDGLRVYVYDYYPGTRIAHAWAWGDTSMLTAQEKKTLDAAKKIVNKYKKDKDPFRKMHDYLVKHVVYDKHTNRSAKLSNNYHTHDTAIGALLDGKADCDGYADALYLLGTMAGYNVRYMYVHYKEKGKEVYHMLNQVWCADGKWRMFDATWDDNGNRARTTYYYMNAAKAGKHYKWTKELYKDLLK